MTSKYMLTVPFGREVYFSGERTCNWDLGGTIGIPVCVPATACRGRRVPAISIGNQMYE